MKLGFDSINAITFGKVRICETEDGIELKRTSEKVQDAFYSISRDFGQKCDATSCINYDFYTDSKTVRLEWCKVVTGSSRKFYYFDVCVNGALVGHFGEEEMTELEGEFSVMTNGNLNRITIYSPMLVGYTLRGLYLDEGARVIPVVKKYKILALGDSITHGYDEKYSSFAYTNLIGRYFDAEVINQAIGGATANRETVEDSVSPDVVTIAYGTNDWSHKRYEDNLRDYHEYVCVVRDNFPDAEIVLLTPIFRGDKSEAQSGPFGVCKEIISSAAQKYGCHLIDGLTLAPHLAEFFSPDYLHPNDMGSFMYAFGLIEQLREIVK